MVKQSAASHVSRKTNKTAEKKASLIYLATKVAGKCAGNGTNPHQRF